MYGVVVMALFQSNVYWMVDVMLIGAFGVYRMKIRQSVENPDSQFVAMPSTITPAGIELNPTTDPIEEPVKTEDVQGTTKL